MANQERLALFDIKFVVIICDQIIEPRIAKRKVQTIGRQLEAKQEAAGEKCARGADEHVAFELWPKTSALDKTEWRRRDRVLPTEFRIVVVRAGQHVEIRQCARGRTGNQRSRPAQLL